MEKGRRRWHREGMGRVRRIENMHVSERQKDTSCNICGSGVRPVGEKRFMNARCASGAISQIAGFELASLERKAMLT